MMWAKECNQEEYYNIQEESNQEVLNKKYFNSIKSKHEMTEELKNKVADYDNKNKTCQKQIDKEVKQFKTECKTQEFNSKKSYFEKFHFKIMSPPSF